MTKKNNPWQQRLAVKKTALAQAKEKIPALLDYGKTLLAYADCISLFGREIDDAKDLAQSGCELQDIAANVEKKQNAAKPFELLQATYLRMRGLSHEASGKRSGLLGVKTLLAARLPEKHEALAQKLSRLDPAAYPSSVDAHAIKVQVILSWGRFYTVAPWPLQDLPRSIVLLEKGLREALANPAGLPKPVEPATAHLFLAEALLLSKKNNRAEIQKHLSRAKALLEFGLSPWEIEIESGVQKLLSVLEEAD